MYQIRCVYYTLYPMVRIFSHSYGMILMSFYPTTLFGRYCIVPKNGATVLNNGRAFEGAFKWT